MKVITNKRKDNTVSLEIEIDHAKLPAAMDTVFHRVKKDVSIKGFRKGKVPRSVFEKHYGDTYLIQEAILDLVNHHYATAISELDLKVVDNPQNVDIDKYTENTPIRFRCDVDVEPVIKLGKYKGIRAEKESTVVSDEELQAELDRIRENRAEFNIVETPIKQDDIVRCKVEAFVDDKRYEQWSRDNAGFRIGAGIYGDDFDKALEGKQTGDEFETTVRYPEEFRNAELAGKVVSFKVKIEDVRSKQLPELTDELVVSLKRDEKTVLELSNKLKLDIQEFKKSSIEGKLRQDILNQVADNASCDIPESMIKQEIDRSIAMFAKQLEQSGLNINQYMEFSKKDLNEFRNEFREPAIKHIKLELALEAIIEKESITVTDDDLRAEVEKWGLPKDKTWEDIKSDPTIDIGRIRDAVLKDKASQLIVDEAKVSENR